MADPLALLTRLTLLACLLTLPGAVALAAQGAAPGYFQIQVVDADTGRGVPLVELKTTNEVRFVTDSNGIAAIGEPELMGRNIHFQVSSHGYEYPADGFGFRGTALQVSPGGKAQLKIKRINVAERLYRITGAGIYRDSLLVGAPAPIRQPLMNGLVMGQDTVLMTPYRGKLYWFWGDTNRPSYPLGNYSTSGATSLPPGQGGLDPAVGVDLTYWVAENGFSKAMIPLTGFSGPVWVGGTFTLKDEQGRERLLTKYAHLKRGGSEEVGEHGLAIFNDEKAVFEKVRAFDPPLYPDGHPFAATADGRDYVYFQTAGMEAYPLVRVRADMKSVTDPRAYEAFTCLAPGARYEKAATRLDRAPDGRLVYGWKADTAPLSHKERAELVAAGKMKAEESPLQLRDIDTDAPIQSHGGSVFWNAYRKRWVMISGQSYGSPSFLGELWFSEADTPVGPWAYARKIVTHDRYTFYNPTQHPVFDQDGGRLIYFEGTYTNTYSGNPDKTPRYDYNQMMYRLALDDPRLSLPAPVYRVRAADGAVRYAQREAVESRREWPQVQAVAFFAVPPARRRDGLIPVYAVTAPAGTTLQTESAGDAAPLFYALPPTPTAGEKPSPAVVPLYEYREGTARWYATDAPAPGATRSEKPLCRVWRNPSTTLALDYDAKPR